MGRKSRRGKEASNVAFQYAEKAVNDTTGVDVAPPQRRAAGFAKRTTRAWTVYIEIGRLQVRVVIKSNDDETTFET